MIEQRSFDGPAGRLWPKPLRILAAIVASLCILVLLLQIPFTWQRIVQLRNDRSQALSLDLIDLKVQFLDVSLAMSGTIADAGTGDTRAQATNFDMLRQSYGAFLDRIVTLDRFDRRGLGAVSVLDSVDFEDLKTRAVSVLPLIRGTDPDLRTVLPAIALELEQISPVLSRLVDDANQQAAQRTQVVRTQIQTDLRTLAILMASLVASTALLLWDFRRLYLFNRKQVQENRLANARLETVVATSQDAIIVT
ncbi:MAG: hypothetical protein LPK02_04280, partial [Rhodobacterales bacterium]|nr:hypothetical protein [Rhodobacterales bacterium]